MEPTNQPQPAPGRPGARCPPLEDALADFERQYLRQALEINNGRRLKTAAMLGIDRKTLYKKLKKYHLE